MEIETTKLSSKGQIVIPERIRKMVNADEGDMFAVMSDKNTIVLRKVEMPSKEELMLALGKMAKEGSKRAEKLGIKESDVPNLIGKLRKSR